MNAPAATVPVRRAPLPADQVSRLFRIYNHYRVIVSAILIIALLVLDTSRNEFYHYPLYAVTASAYLAVSVFTAFLLLARFTPRNQHISVSFFLDVVALSLLMYASDGIDSGLSNLMLITVAASNILIQGRVAIFFAALASLAVLSVETSLYFNALSHQAKFDDAGLFGMVYFLTALLIQALSRRIQASSDLAEARAKDILELEQINHLIIQRMRTGILLCNARGITRMMNSAARQLLSIESPGAFVPLPAALAEEFHAWQQDRNRRPKPFRMGNNRPWVQPNFARLQKDNAEDVLIFLEDTSKVTQQAQQLKLASLGRLTAGIAHEIRNPLGAISHAAQLLAESDTLDSADQRMNTIILRHCERMNRVIENVLQLSRRQQPASELIELNTWLTEFVDDLHSQIHDGADIQLELTNEAPTARFDPSQLSQVMQNLCINGLHYSREHSGHATLTLRTRLSRKSQQAQLEVMDSGPGIDAEAQAQLFEPFFTTRQGGTGLGLYISRELCESNQALLEYVQGERDSGACFRITFAHPDRIH